MVIALDRPSGMAPESFYVAIRLVYLVQKAKECSKSPIKKCIKTAKPSKGPRTSMLPFYDRKTLSSIVKSPTDSDRYFNRCRTVCLPQGLKLDIDPLSLLEDLDLYSQHRGLSLRAVAAQDSLFLRHEFRFAGTFKNLETIYYVFDLTIALLGRLQFHDGACHRNHDVPRGDFKCEKFLANLDHLLRCLRQIALDAIARHCLHLVEAHISHWHEYWQHQKRIDEGWFAEWPKDLSDAWINTPSDTFPKYSWLHPQQAGVRVRRANATPASQAVSHSYQASVSANPYIRTTSNESSDRFATSTVQWPYCQGINQDPLSVHPPTYTPWQSTYSTTDNITGTLTATPQSLDPQTPSQTYAPLQQADTNPQAAAGGVGTVGFGLGSYLQTMQGYPSPHSNVSEETTSSCLSVLPGAIMTPGRPIISSPIMVPSLGGSENSRQSSRRSVEPPRNAQGVLSCSHPDCANKHAVFSRKCEWKKHMDKHSRPYVCEEPECENIRGFTYSGGLLRHQREVHRQHGGPKASCMCPYKDCKRSTGVGFSRKENLNEHLRRCHQPRRESQGNSPADTQDVSSSSRPRKRRRGGNDEDEDDKDEEGQESNSDLQREVKKLRRELAERDERLRRLETMMESLTKGHGAPK